MAEFLCKEVTVVVVNHNRCDLLAACLRSLTRQQGVNFDVMLVDNGSSDNSLEMVRREFLDPGLLSLTILTNAGNTGFCAANNQGIAASQAEFIALLNNDAEAEPGWLAGLRSVFLEPDLGMAACKIVEHRDPRRIDKAGHLIYWDGQNRGRGTGEWDTGQYDRIEEVAWPDGCAAMYRRKMLDEIGGFDEDLFAYADDAELGLRARIAGWRCLYTPAAVVRHHRGQTLGVHSIRRVKLIERNRVLLAVKHFPWSLLWLNGFYYALRVAASAWAAARGKGEASKALGPQGKLRIAWALMAGDMEALFMLPKMLRKRRALRPLRRLTTSQIKQLLLHYQIPLRQLAEQSL